MGRRRRVSPWVRAAQRAVAVVAAGAAWAVAYLPDRPRHRLGSALGGLAYALLRGRRRVALANLERAFGAALDREARATVARASFRHLGMMAVECCRLFVGPPGSMLSRIRMVGLENLEAARALGRGAFYLTAHFGNWELLAASRALTGAPLSVVVRPLDNPFLETWLARGRERAQLNLIPKRSAVRGVRAALARGDCVGILLDQNAGRQGVFVPFFGHAASTSRSLAVLALKTGAPVVPAFIHRLADGDHEVFLEPAIPVVRTGDREHDIAASTARFTEVIERHVRAHPEQWFWVHRRWKTRPLTDRSTVPSTEVVPGADVVARIP